MLVTKVLVPIDFHYICWSDNGKQHRLVTNILQNIKFFVFVWKGKESYTGLELNSPFNNKKIPNLCIELDLCWLVST